MLSFIFKNQYYQKKENNSLHILFFNLNFQYSETFVKVNVH